MEQGRLVSVSWAKMAIFSRGWKSVRLGNCEFPVGKQKKLGKCWMSCMSLTKLGEIFLGGLVIHQSIFWVV